MDLKTITGRVEYLKERYDHLEKLIAEANREITLAISSVGEILHKLKGTTQEEK